jgi:hypothetical protein
MSKFETFNILSWDPIYVNSENTNAMIYIKPTLNLLKYFQEAPMNNILVSISGTKHDAYENRIVFGTIDKSSDIPNKRDNMFNCTGLYCITLDLVWQGYPLEKGNVSFYIGVVDKIVSEILPNDTDKISKKSNKNSPINNNNYYSLLSNTNNDNEQHLESDKTKRNIYGYIFFISILVILIIYIYSKSKN